MFIDDENVEIKDTYLLRIFFFFTRDRAQNVYPGGKCFSTALKGYQIRVPEKEYVPVVDLVVVDPIWSTVC